MKKYNVMTTKGSYSFIGKIIMSNNRKIVFYREKKEHERLDDELHVYRSFLISYFQAEITKNPHNNSPFKPDDARHDSCEGQKARWSLPPVS
jgi:hypothetical protein